MKEVRRALMDSLKDIFEADWDKAEVLFFLSEKEFRKWVFECGARVVGSITSEDSLIYFVLVDRKAVVAKVKPTVDDFYVPRDVAEAKLDEDYVTEKAESHDFTNPALFCKDLRDLFYAVLDLATVAGGFVDLSPEDAKKLLDMAEYIEKASKLLRKRVLDGIKSYMSGVVFGVVKDDRWTEERVRRVFRDE